MISLLRKEQLMKQYEYRVEAMFPPFDASVLNPSINIKVQLPFMRYKEIIYRRLFIYNFVWGHRGEGPGSLLYGEVPRDRRPLSR